MEPWDGSDRLELVARRSAFLDRLAGDPARKPTLVEDLDASRSTVDRAIRRLEEAGLVERTDRGYVTTVPGRLAADRYRAFLDDERAVFDADGVLSVLPPDADVPAALATDGDAEVAPDAPHRLYDRVAEDVATADRCRAILPLLGDSRPLRLCHARAVEGCLDASLVAASSVVDRVSAEFPHLSAELAAADAVSVWTGEVRPFELYLTTEDGATTVTLVAFDDDGPVGRLRADGEAAVAWAEDCWSAVRAAASPAGEDLVAAGDDHGVPPAAAGTPSLGRAGVRRVTREYFTDRTPADPATAWRAGFDLVDVYYGYALEREHRPGAAGTGSGPDDAPGERVPGPRSDERERGDAPAERPRDDGGRTVVEVLVERLAAGEDTVVVGPPGAGKSTTCRAVACRWIEAGRGPALYRTGRGGDPDGLAAALVEAVDDADGHALVVVEDGGTVPEPTLDALDRLRDRNDATLLVAARASDWRAAGAELADARLQELHADALAAYRLSGVDERTCRRAIEAFEAATGRSVPLSAAELLAEVHNGDGAGEMYLLGHLLTAHTVRAPWDEAGEPTALEADVRDCYDALAGADDDALALEVGLLVATLTAAERPVSPGDAHAVAAARRDDDAGPAVHGRVDDALDLLSGRMLFGRDESGAYRTQHPFWAVRFLAHALAREDRRTVARFERAVDALFSLAADDRRRQRIADWLGGDAPALARFEDDAAVDGLADAVFGLAPAHSELIPLFGTGEHSGIELPGAYATEKRLEAASCRAHAWHDHGDLDRAAAAFESVCRRAAAADGPPEVVTRYRAEGRCGLGEVHESRDDLEAARENFERALSVARDGDDAEMAASALNSLAWLAIRTDDYDAAERRLDDALDELSGIGPSGYRADALYYRGKLARRRGNLRAAGEWLERTRQQDRELGNRQGEASTLHTLGLVAEERGDHGAAESYFRRSVERRRETDDRPGTAATLHRLGDLLVETGDLEAAEDCLSRARAICADVGMDGLAGQVHNARGNLALAREDLEAAADRYRAGRERNAAAEADRHVAASDLGLGDVAAERGDHDTAVDRYRDAFETLSDVGATTRALDAAERLLDASGARGNQGAAREWCEACIDLAAESGLDDRRATFEDRLADLTASADD